MQQINKELPAYLLTVAFQDINSSSAVKNSLYICSANDKMPYSGQLNTNQKEMPQLLLLDSSTFSSLLPESCLLFSAFAVLFSTIAVMHEKKTYNIPIVLWKLFHLYSLKPYIFFASGSSTYCRCTTLTKRQCPALKQRWNKVTQRGNNVAQRWYNVDTTLFQPSVDVTLNYIESNRTSGDYEFAKT